MTGIKTGDGVGIFWPDYTCGKCKYLPRRQREFVRQCPVYHILTRAAVWQGKKVFAFTKPGDITAQQFATQLVSTGQVIPPSHHQKNWTPLSFLPRQANLFRKH
jgi:hypothetical protein